MAAIDDIISWAQGLPKWEADAVRRILAAGDDALTPETEVEIFALARAELNIGASPAGIAPVPPSPGMFSGASGTVDQVTLVSIENVQNVNAIQPGSSLTFSKNGLTVVYGNNGAGKSGYTRILKLSCNARDKDERVLGNVFQAAFTVPSATLHVELNGQPTVVQWNAQQPANAILTSISAFDARCARIITDEKNEITYLPYGADVFEKLARLVGKLKTGIESEISPQQPIQDSAVIGGSPSASFLAQLTGFTEDAEIEVATKWESADDLALLAKEELLAKSEVEPALKEIDRLTKVKARVDSTAQAIRDQYKSLASISESAIKAALAELKIADDAREMAIKESQADDPLKGVGTAEAWRNLYHTAKRYSEEVAYEDQGFPVVKDGALCVLCQQVLQPAATARMTRFRKFMEDTTAEAVATRKKVVLMLRDSATRLKVIDSLALDALADEMTPFDPDAGEYFKGLQTAVGERRKAAIGALDAYPVTDIKLPAIPAPADAPLVQVSIRIEQRLGAIKSASDPEQHKKLQFEIRDLRSRRALRDRKQAIKDYVQRDKRNIQLRIATAELKTLEITKKGIAIISKNLTPEFLKAFKAELKELGVDHLPLSVKPAGASGETQHEFKLEGVALPSKTKLSQVLSEGESRVIAIAGFLAELATAKSSNPIVLDDPVSSLDHVYTATIAKRLAKEAQHRQVIVFTHNIAFLMELDDAVEALGNAGTPIKYEVRTLRKLGSDAGVSAGGLPWHAMKVNQRAAYLEGLITKIKPVYVTDRETYNREAAQVYGLLREAWESSVEEDVFYAVVSRYRNSVKTMQLVDVEIDDKDIHEIDAGMTKCSTWMTGHDKSKALHTDRPSPNEVLSDIKALRDFSAKIVKRRDQTRKRRKDQTKAKA